MISIQTFTFNPFSENSYILFDETKEAVIIDPGNFNNEENETITSFIGQNGLKPVRIVNTHAHIDHVLGVAYLKEHYKIPFSLHKDDMPVLKSGKVSASNFGFPSFWEPEVDSFIDENDTIEFGNSKLSVRFVPGHAPGHIAFINEEQKFVIGGDVLFYQSIGRTDLPGGSFTTLIESIRTQLFTLDDEYKVYAGHMQPTTIGHEKKHNPFLQ